MSIKKSELYSSLWSGCDELRGGMDASQYKDYVLVLLFIKYVSDKYAGVPYAPITIPEGASFKDMVALKGKPDIGDQINKKIIGPLANANKLSDMPDFNDPSKLGSGQEIVERLTNLIAIFENKALDFSKNRAEGDDILGDAYEYLMRHFATESGKSKGQFYTPAELAEDLLAHYTGKPLIEQYDVYQHLMDYWAATMQDDCYLIAADGWKAETYRIIEVKKNKEGKTVKETDKGWTCDLVSKQLIVNRYFAAQQADIREQEATLESLTAQMTELEEEHGGEEGAFSELDNVNKANVTARLKEITGNAKPRLGDKKEAELGLGVPEEAILCAWLRLANEEIELKKAVKEAEAELDAMAYAKYPALTEAEIKMLVVEDKWLTSISAAIHGEMDRISQALTQRVRELAERYESPLPQLEQEVKNLAVKVEAHLAKMGFNL